MTTRDAQKSPVPRYLSSPRPLIVLAAMGVLAGSFYGYVSAVSNTILNDPSSTFDDAFMFVRYADNFLAGHGIVWNPGEKSTYGVTSLLYLLVIIALRAASSIDAALVVPIASSLWGVIASCLITLACVRALRDPKLWTAAVLGAVIAPLSLLDSTYLYHATTGMDTTLGLAMNALLVLAVLEALRRPKSLWCGLAVIAAYGSFLARPDNGLYATAFPVLAILLLAEPARRRHLLIGFVCAFGAIILVDTIVKWAYFGTPLPLSYYSKIARLDVGYAGRWKWNPIGYLCTFFGLAWPCVLVLLIGARRQHRRDLVVFLLPVLLTFSYYSAIVQIMGFHARFYVPALPFFFVIGVRVLADLRTGMAVPTLALRMGLAIALTFVLKEVRQPLIVWYSRSFLASGERRPGPAARTQPPPSVLLPLYREMSHFAALCPPGTVIGATEVGYLGIAAPRATVVDLAGLNDRHIARHGCSLEYLLVERRVDLLWLPHPDYTALVQALLSDPAFEQSFLYLPGAFDYGLAIRRDSPRRVEIMTALRTSWLRVYHHPLETWL